MQFWWCNQSDSFELESAAQVVRSSAETRNPRYRKTVGEARRGDIVVHYRKGSIVAFSRAKEDGQKKESLPDDYGRGWEFRTEYHMLTTPIPGTTFRNQIDVPSWSGFALSATGRVNQGYFFKFNLDGLATLLTFLSSEEELPKWLETFRSTDDLCDGDLDTVLKEGQRYKKHLRRERNPQLVKEAKRIHGYICQSCDFNFETYYGSRGKQYIEAHHLVPFHQLDREISPSLSAKKDFGVVCANCHRMLHHQPYLSIQELKKLIKAQRKS